MLLSTVGLLLASAVPSMVLLLVSLIRTPEWISDSGTLQTWRRASVLAAATGFATSALFGVLVLVTHTMAILPVADICFHKFAWVCLSAVRMDGLQVQEG